MQKYPKFSGILPLDPTRESLQHPLLPTAPQTPQMHSSFSPRYACQKTGTPPKLLDTALTWFLMVFHLTFMRFSQSTHLLMHLSLKVFNVHQKNWLIYPGGTDRLDELVIVFLSQTTLLPS